MSDPAATILVAEAEWLSKPGGYASDEVRKSLISLAKEPGVISVAEAAHLAGVSGTVIRRWIARGDVQARKPPGQTCGWLVDRVSLAAYAAVPRKRGCPVGRRWRWKR